MAKERPAPGDLELVRGFVNTLDIEAGTDDMKTPDELRGWLVSNGLLEPGTTVTVADVRRAVELREALRALLLANNGVAAPASAAAVLDNVARRARLGPRFRADGTSPLEPDADGADGSLGRLLAIVHAAMADGSWARLKVCRSGDCWWGFWDATKNRSGTWCEMGLCGNRAKARSYRERHRGEMVG